MIYLIQIIIYSALFYTVYLLFLKNRASHQWNRFYLLVSATLPLVIPFIKIPALYSSIPPGGIKTISVIIPAITVFAKKQAAIQNIYNLEQVFFIVYLLAALTILSASAYQYLLFRRFVGKHKYEVINGVKVLSGTNAGPGSFLNYIFLPGKEINPVIFEHEMAHIRLKHSRDILFIRLLQCLFWPNFILHFILKELKIVHEFQADAIAVKNEDYYVSELLNDVFGTKQFALSHTFFYHPLKRRIMMLTHPVSRTKLRMAKSKAVIAATVLLAGIIYLQSCSRPENKASSPQQPGTDVATEKNATMAGGTRVYSIAKIMPSTSYDLSGYLSSHIKYPESAQQKGTQGRVMVRFVVDEEGNVVNPVILRSPDTVLSTEALRVISQLPKWNPGEQDGKKVAVYFTLPIFFKLEGKTQQQ